jgi:hypothetical protein
MKKIINGVRYDSDKATLVGEYATNLGRNDFRDWEAALYVSPKSRRFFLVGEGGPMTRFAKPVGSNGMTGSEDLIPMDRDEALAWAEQFLDTEAIEQHFADHVVDA